MKHLSGLDAFFLHGETPKQAMNLTGIGCYDPTTSPNGKVSFEEVLDYARERTQRSALFRRKLAWVPLGLDQPYWVEDADFSVDNHVFHVSLPPPGNREQLNDEIARIHALVIDRAHPLWQWWFIEGLNAVEGVPPGSFALAFKLHHAAFDGVSAWEVVDVSHDKSPDEGPRQDGPSNTASNRNAAAPAPSGLKVASETYMRALVRPGKFAETLWGASKLLVEATRREVKHFPLFAGKAPDTPFNRPLEQQNTRSNQDDIGRVEDNSDCT